MSPSFFIVFISHKRAAARLSIFSKQVIFRRFTGLLKWQVATNHPTV